MRLLSLSATVLVLALSGNMTAPQGLLVQHDDKNDPCGRFKMRILIPANVDDGILPAKKFSRGIDPGMVWDPCTNGAPQIAMLIYNAAPHATNLLLSKSPFPGQPFTGENGQQKPQEVFLGSPASTFPFPKRQP